MVLELANPSNAKLTLNWNNTESAAPKALIVIGPSAGGESISNNRTYLPLVLMPFLIKALYSFSLSYKLLSIPTNPILQELYQDFYLVF